MSISRSKEFFVFPYSFRLVFDWQLLNYDLEEFEWLNPKTLYKFRFVKPLFYSYPIISII
jgi:hypothetical protein